MTPPADRDPLVAAALRGPAGAAVRRRLLRQLLTSLIYEGAVEAAVGPADGTGLARHTLTGRDRDDRPVRYHLDARRARGFDRVVAGPDVVSREAPDGTHAEADSVARVLGELAGSILGGAHPGELARFAGELEETRVKDALAQHVRALRGDVLAGADHDALEGLVTEGHRYHPAYKSRIGFDVDDDLDFGPEFLPTVRPRWVAAHRSVTVASGARDLARSELGNTAAAFDARVAATGAAPEDHVWLPVHPWQWRERARAGFADLLAAGLLVPLGEDPGAFVPQQSIRTMACRDDPTRHQLKLALSITNTSTARGLAPHTVANAAPISAWLARLVDRDPWLRDVARPIVLGEVAGVAVVPEPASDLVRDRTEGVLAAIWREPLAPRLDPGERAVPATALTATELDGTPLVAPWLAAHGAPAWTAALVDALALPLVHLLVRHGVALESHAQNVSLCHVDGWPTRAAFKDFHDGVRFSRARLADPQDAPALDPPPAHHANRNSFVETDDPALVTDFLLDAFFFVNLGELALHLEAHGLLDEDAFWTIVARRVRAHVDAVDRAHGPVAYDLFAPTLAVEKLTTRRLAPDTELRLLTVPNPLHRYDPARADRGAA